MSTSVLSATALSDIIATRDAIIEAYNRGDISANTARDKLSNWLIELGSWVGTGDADFIDSLGPDYICTLDDGRVVAWGRDITTIQGDVDRELVIYSEPNVGLSL